MLQELIVRALMEPARINGRFTCKEIAYMLPGSYREAQVNAAISGMSIRSRQRKFLTDQPAHADPHRAKEFGLFTPWQKRAWRLTEAGIIEGRKLLAADVATPMEAEVERVTTGHSYDITLLTDILKIPPDERARFFEGLPAFLDAIEAKMEADGIPLDRLAGVTWTDDERALHLLDSKPV